MYFRNVIRTLVLLPGLFILFSEFHQTVALDGNSIIKGVNDWNVDLQPRRALQASFWHPKNFNKQTEPTGKEESAVESETQDSTPADAKKKQVSLEKDSTQPASEPVKDENEAVPSPDAESEAQESTPAEANKKDSTQPAPAPAGPAPFGPGVTNAEVLSSNCTAIFAAFFVSKPGGFKRAPGVRCNGCHESPLHITLDSARIMHPGTCTALLTDMETDLSGVKGIEDVHLHRFAGVVNRDSIGTPNLMYERMKTYKAFVERALENGYDKHLILLDTDIVVVGDVFHLFKQEFDYGLSARANENLPVQGGLQLVHKNRYEKAKTWLGLVLKRWEVEVANSKRQEFGFTADQYQYQYAIGDKAPLLKIAKTNKVGTLKVDKGEDGTFDLCLIPADRYNRTPGGPGSMIKKSKVSILHYKGGRKDDMYVVYDPLKKGGLKAVYALKGMTG